MRVAKHWSILLVFMLVVAIVSGCGGKAEQTAGSKEAPKNDKEIKMKMSVTTSEKSTWTQGAQMWADKVKEKTGGKVQIKVYANEQLSNGNTPKGIELLQNGSTDASLHSTIIYSGLDEKFSVISMPWLFTDEAVADKALAGPAGEKLSALLREKGVEPLAFGENGFRQITNSKKAIASPADMEGLKIRIPNMKMYIDLYKELGADPTSMSFSEVFTSLQQGTIDGQENPLPVIVSSKLYEVQKHVSLWNYSYDPLVLGVNKKLFDSMDKETQDILKQTAIEAMEYQRKINREEDKKLVQELEKQGVTVTKLTPEQVKAFQDKAAPIYDKYTDVIGKDLLDAFRTTK